jgi:hypothetical protein
MKLLVYEWALREEYMLALQDKRVIGMFSGGDLKRRKVKRRKRRK